MILVMSIAIFPPEAKELEGGGGGGGTIALNFGFDDYGMGDNYTSPDPVSAPSETVTSSSTESEILTSDNIDAVAIENTPKPKKDDKKPTPDKKPEPKPVATTPVKPQPSNTVTNALSNVLGGDGNSNKSGNQGDRSGQLNNQGYDGSGGSGGGTGGGIGTGDGTGTGSGIGSGSGSGSGGGSGSGHGNYRLDGRKVTSRPQPEYKCNEEGRVVVEIYVDRTGKVVNARAGVQGTTNPAFCLVDIAKKAAMETRFEPSQSAAERQKGEITFNFTLTK
jgi:TonB family protein